MAKMVLTIAQAEPLIGGMKEEQIKGEGELYTETPQAINNEAFAQLVGKKAYMYAKKTGREALPTDTQFLEGNIVVNELTGEVGLILDSDLGFLDMLNEDDAAALVEVAPQDGWIKASDEAIPVE
jgi:hypothetical protein